MRRAIERSGLSSERQEIIAHALVDRMRRISRTEDRESDIAALESAVQLVIREIGSDPEVYRMMDRELTAWHVDAILDGLCERIALPWPLCPARD